MPLKEQRQVLSYDQDGNRISKITLHERLPYYNRDLPLVFRCAFSPNGLVVWSDFGDFRIDYEGTIYGLLTNEGLKGVARDTKGKTIAEAVGIALERGVGATFRETHFDPHGTVQFSARSFFDFDGIKRHETETIGQKIGDYFFYCPLRES